LAELGHEDFVAYVVWSCERALERGLLPHTNLGALPAADLERLRAVTASQGLMLESLRDDLVVHQGSPTKDPQLRLQTIRDAGRLKIPFTSGILVGIGETPQDRVAVLEALAHTHEEFGHLQEVIIQNVVPHRRYYGEEPADIATAAAERFWRTGLHESADGPLGGLPEWANRYRCRSCASSSRSRASCSATRSVSSAAEPFRALARARGRGRDRPRRAERQRRPHLARAPLSVAAPGRRAAGPGRRRSARALCAYRRYLVPEWQDERVLAIARDRFPTFVPATEPGFAASFGTTSVA